MRRFKSKAASNAQAANGL